MANYTNKTIQDIFNSFIAEFNVLRNKYNDKSPILEKSVIKSIGFSLSSLVGTLWKQAKYIFKQCFPQSCSLKILKLWGNLIGVDYKYGQSAILQIELTNVTADSLPSATVYKDLSSGLIYKTNSQSYMSNGNITATAVCSQTGSSGNIQPGTILNIANPYTGIPSTAAVKQVLTEGSEDEAVETYRKRVLYRFRKKSQGGSSLDYYNWAMEVSGINDAFPYVLEEGVMTLFIVANGSGKNRDPSGKITPNPFPKWENGIFQDFEGSGQFLQVANSIEGSSLNTHDRRPATDKVNLLKPNYTGFCVKITGLTDISYAEKIKNVLINTLDAKRPHIKVLNYKASNAKINKLSLSADISSVIDDQTFTDFELIDDNGNNITEATLGIGCLAYLKELYINGSKVTL